MTTAKDKGPEWEGARPTAIVGARLRQVRKRAGLSAAKLAERLAAFGMPELTRWAITNLETGRRDSVSIDEVFVLAYALGVAPVHLFVPIEDTYDDDDLFMQVTPGMSARVDVARRWVIGDDPLPPPRALRNDAAYRETYWREAPLDWRDRRRGGVEQ